MHRGESVTGGLGGEPWPPLRLCGDVGDEYGRLAGETVHARTLVDAELEQLEQAGLLGRRGEHLQAAAFVGQCQAGRGDVKQLHTLLHQRVQQIRDVVVVDQSVRQGHERPGHLPFAVDHAHHLLVPHRSVFMVVLN